MEAIITFAISLVILSVFLGFKVWEAKRRKKVLPGLRKKADALVSDAGTKVHTTVGDSYKNMSFKKTAEATVGHTARVVANTAQKVESGATHLAEKVLKSNGERRETNSNFLKEVSSHKKSLDTESVKRDTRL